MYSAVDGGITANNPAMCAFTEAMKMGLPIVGRQFHPEEIALLSIGKTVLMVIQKTLGRRCARAMRAQ